MIQVSFVTSECICIIWYVDRYIISC